MKYIVQSTAVWDTIYLPGSKTAMNAPGGAGFYALCGMKVWEDDVLIVTGTGADYIINYRDWYQSNGLSINGLMSKDPYAPRTIVRYALDGERTETPCFGHEHYRNIEATPNEIEPYLKDVSGVYVFKNTAPAYWNGMLHLKKELHFPLMWEVAVDAAVPEQREMVRTIAECTDVFSINRTEALTMFATDDLSVAAERLAGWEIPLIYLRLGSEGVCLIGDGRQVFVPSIPDIKVVDSTGGGNSSSGGAMIGYCRGYSLEEIGAMGNVSASFCIGQWGGPARFDDVLRAEAERRKALALSLCRKDRYEE